MFCKTIYNIKYQISIYFLESIYDLVDTTLYFCIFIKCSNLSPEHLLYSRTTCFPFIPLVDLVGRFVISGLRGFFRLFKMTFQIVLCCC